MLLNYRHLWNLGAGASSAHATAVTVPTGLAPGTYYVDVIADYLGSEPESDETNNAALAVQTLTVVRDIDLVGTEVTPSVASIGTGGPFTVSNTVMNQGTTPTTGARWNVGVYLSSDATVTPGGVLLNYRHLWNLGAGASSTHATAVTVPTGLAPGTYYVGVIADYLGSEPETDETNNAAVAAQTVEVSP